MLHEKVMKILALFSSLILLTGCSFGSSAELIRAEKLFSQFECNNIESTQITHSDINTYHQQSLGATKAKVRSYIENYKDGEAELDMPLDEVVAQQYQLYKAACESLGGISPDE